MGRTKKVDIDELINLYNQGYSETEIADELNMRSVKYVAELISKLGLSDSIDRGKVKALHNAGWKPWKIAAECDLSESEVLGIIYESNLLIG